MFSITDNNYKNALLEIAQCYFGVERPQYIHFDYGPHHAKVFRCICIFNQQMTSSIGRTKTEAEQSTSEAMLNKLKKLHFKKIDTAWIFSEAETSSMPPHILSSLENLNQDPSLYILTLYGDAVLRSIIAQYLYTHYAEFREGVLTLIISEAMREETRARIATHLKLEGYGAPGMTPRTLASTLSAVVGKLHLGGPNDTFQELILEHYQPLIDHAVSIILRQAVVAHEAISGSAIKTSIHNFKNELQEHAQRYSLRKPIYRLSKKEGSEHAPLFTMECTFGEIKKMDQGVTVKSAEQNAAKNILESIHPADFEPERVVSRSQTYSSALPASRGRAWDEVGLEYHLNLPAFVSPASLKTAFTHASLEATDNYQRLEFLGDAILRMLILEYLLQKYSHITDKAVLSPIVDQLVSAETQIKIAKRLKLYKYVLSAAPITDGVLGDVLEALIAVVYMDGKENAQGCGSSIIMDWFKPEIIYHLRDHHLNKEGAGGWNNFPGLGLRASTTTNKILNEVPIRSYATVVASAQRSPKKPQAIVESGSKKQEEFPSLPKAKGSPKTVGSLVMFNQSSSTGRADREQLTNSQDSNKNKVKGQRM